MKVQIFVVVEKKGVTLRGDTTITDGTDAWPWKRTRNREELVNAATKEAAALIKRIVKP